MGPHSNYILYLYFGVLPCLKLIGIAVLAYLPLAFRTLAYFIQISRNVANVLPGDFCDRQPAEETRRGLPEPFALTNGRFLPRGSFRVEDWEIERDWTNGD